MSGSKIITVKNTNHKYYQRGKYIKEMMGENNRTHEINTICRKDLPDELLLDDEVIDLLIDMYRAASPLVRYFE